MKAFVTIELLIVLCIIAGAIILVPVLLRLYNPTYSLCWKQTVDPFFGIKKFSDTLNQQTVDMHLNPLCTQKIILTDSADRCIDACGNFQNCLDNCKEDDISGKSFFVLVHRELDWWDTVKDVFQRKGEALKAIKEESYSVSINCDTEADYRYKVYKPGAAPSCKRLVISKEGHFCKIEERGC